MKSTALHPRGAPGRKVARDDGDDTHQRRWPLPLHSALVAQMLAKPILLPKVDACVEAALEKGWPCAGMDAQNRKRNSGSLRRHERSSGSRMRNSHGKNKNSTVPNTRMALQSERNHQWLRQSDEALFDFSCPCAAFVSFAPRRAGATPPGAWSWPQEEARAKRSSDARADADGFVLTRIHPSPTATSSRWRAQPPSRPGGLVLGTP